MAREDLLLRARKDRAQASADRAQAADDRRHAAADRAHAARERAAVEQQRAGAALRLELALTDALTGTRTRGFGLKEVEREIERAHRTGSRLVLGFIDLDDLKGVNDREGHLVGDEFLQAVAATLRANVRAYDVIVRFGGDEFVCAMPNITAADAGLRLERINPALAAETPRSISFGLADLEPGDDLHHLLTRADQALLAGRSRRNATRTTLLQGTARHSA